MRGADPQAGFSLVEVLVAFAILALTAIAGFNVLSDGARRTGQIENRLEILAAAKAELARIEAGLESHRDTDPRLRVTITALPGSSDEQEAPWPRIVRIWKTGDESEPLLASIIVLPPPK